MNVDDLLDPLRYENLRDFTAANLESIGGGVFTERDTLEHLRMLDLIAKAYQSVHLPAYGRVIPGQTNSVTAVFGSSKQTVDLLTVPVNQTWRILGISAKTADNYEFGSAVLQINGFDVLSLADIDTKTDVFGGVITNINDDLIITGGNTLSITSSNQPNNDVQIQVLYDLHQQ